MRARRLALSTLALVATVAAPATAASAPDRYRVVVNVQQAAGDPGVLDVGAPLKVVVRAAAGNGGPIRVCLEPAPIDRPSCTAGQTGETVDAGAPSAAGRTRLRIERLGGRAIERTLRVVADEDARRSVKLRFVRRPVAVFTPRASGRAADLSILVRLNRPMPASGMRRPALLVAPKLLAGEVFHDDQQFFGGITPSRYGRASRHCYLAEAQQRRPLTRPREGARWYAGLHRLGRVATTAPVTIQRAIARDAYVALAAAGRRMGC